MPPYTTIEYELQGRQSVPPVFLLVIDTTVDTKELASLKDSLQQNLTYLPDNALVGIISFGTHVEVHELSSSDISRSYVFNGKKEYATSKVADMLGLRGSVAQSQVSFVFSFERLDWCSFCCISLLDASMVIDTILSELEKDPVGCVDSFSPSGLWLLNIEQSVLQDVLSLLLPLCLRLHIPSHPLTS